MDRVASKHDTFEAIRRSLAESLPKGGEAWLYGSRARGDAREDSDWDVLVLLDKERVTLADRERINYPLYDLAIDMEQLISPKVYTKKEWEWRHFTPFYNNVMHDRKKFV